MDMYDVKTLGISSSVQWLMTAPEGACYLIAAKGRSADNAFSVLAYEDTKDIGRKQYEVLFNRHIQHTCDVAVTHAITDTPKKRLQCLKDAVPVASTPEPFNKRVKWE